MKCDDCKQAEATVHVSRTINGQNETRNWCQACAQKHPEWLEFAGLGGNFGNSFGGSSLSDGFGGENLGMGFFPVNWPAHFFGDSLASLFEPGEQTGLQGGARNCPACGRPWSEVRRTGMLGCPTCYEAFRARLDEIFNRLQRGDRHTGRKPGTVLQSGHFEDPHVADTTTVPHPLTASAAESAAAGTTGQGGAGPVSDRALKLKEALNKAVAAEDYLEAARLRDELKAAEQADDPGQGPAAAEGKGEAR